MLVFTRRVGQSFFIGDDIMVKVVAMRNGEIRIGIQAPRHISVDREEIRQRKCAEHDETLTAEQIHAMVSETFNR